MTFTDPDLQALYDQMKNQLINLSVLKDPDKTPPNPLNLKLMGELLEFLIRFGMRPPDRIGVGASGRLIAEWLDKEKIFSLNYLNQAELVWVGSPWVRGKEV